MASEEVVPVRRGRFTGTRVIVSSLAKAVLRAVSVLGIAGLALVTGTLFVERGRHAPEMLAAWILGLMLGVVLLRRLAAWRVEGTFVLQLAIMAAVGGWLHRGPERSELPAEGDAFVAALAQHFVEHGSYPDSLEALGIRPRRNAYGGWRYEPREGGRSYHLRCGEYFEDGFILYRSAEDEIWQWDT